MVLGRRVAPAMLLIFAGCSTAPVPEKKAPEPPKPITGLSAIYNMYRLARTWAPDAMPLRAQSYNIADPKSENGRAGAWSAVFVSPSRRKQKMYTYSTVEGDFHKDAFAGHDESWGGDTRQSQSFRIEALKTDTDKAWELAVSKSEKYIKANPDVPVFIQLERTDRFGGPAWRIIWGESVSKSSHSIFVDTATGQYLQTGR